MLEKKKTTTNSSILQQEATYLRGVIRLVWPPYSTCSTPRNGFNMFTNWADVFTHCMEDYVLFYSSDLEELNALQFDNIMWSVPFAVTLPFTVLYKNDLDWINELNRIISYDLSVLEVLENLYNYILFAGTPLIFPMPQATVYTV